MNNRFIQLYVYHNQA